MNKSIGYVYDSFFALPPALGRSFGAVSGVPIPGDIRARQESILWQEQRTTLGTWDARSQALAGWTLSLHHTYDPIGKVLYQGDGSRRNTASNLNNIITTVAGTGVAGFSGDGGLATQAQINDPRGVTVAPDGSLLIADTYNHRIRRVGPDGIISTIAGTGVNGFSGDGGPASAASFSYPTDIAVAPDGSLFIRDVPK